MSIPLPSDIPQKFKPLGHYMKIALEHDTRDPVVAYWCRFHTVQQGLAIDKSSPDTKQFLFALLDWLEQKKRELKTNEAISSEPTAEAYLEDYILKIFSWADAQDRAGVFNKNVVKAFYTSGILTDILTNFNNGELPDEFKNISKYAKWKAAYIHNCLKKGETPIPGPMADPEGGDGSGTDEFGGSGNPWGMDVGLEGAAGGAPASSSGAGIGFHQPQPQPSNSSIPSSSNSMYQNYIPPSQPQQPFLPQASYPNPTSSNHNDSTSDVGSSSSTAQGMASHLCIADLSKAQKYCKWASSALDYEDSNTAIVNLEKALRLLRTGKDE